MSYKDSAWWVKFVYFATRGLLILAFVIFLWNMEFESAFLTALIFVGILIPSLLNKKFNFSIPFEIDVFIGVFVYLTLFLGSLNDYYEKFHWWDKVLHFKSGFLLGILGFSVIYILNYNKVKKINLSPGFISFFSVCFSLSISVVWEIYEYVMDTYFGYTMQAGGLKDTMGDLVVNGVGAIIVATIAYIWMRKERKVPFTPYGLRKPKSE